MKVTGTELQGRNRYIEVLNNCEADINRALCNLQVEVENPLVITKRKLHEMEDLFYEHEMNFYDNDALGQMLRDYLLLRLHEIVDNDLRRVIDFESIITLKGKLKSFRPPITNPFIAKYNEKKNEIASFKIDEKLPETMGKYMSADNLLNILFMSDDLNKLGYTSFADKVRDTMYIELTERLHSYQKKKK